MTPKQIQSKYATIKRRESGLHNQLIELQSICAHDNVDKKYKGNSGNYDPTCDAYWIEWKCPDCGKYWITDQ